MSVTGSTSLEEGMSGEDLHPTSFLFTVLQAERELEAHYWLVGDSNLHAHVCFN